MKYIILLQVVIYFFSTFILVAQIDPTPIDKYVSYYDSTWKDYSQKATIYSPHGEVFTPKGTIRALIIFARFTNDLGQSCGNWAPGTSAPDFVNTINSTAPDLIYKTTSDFSTYENTDNRSISRHFYEMSMGSFNFLGDILCDENGETYCIEVDPTSANYQFPYNAIGWHDINKRVITVMMNRFPNFDWAPYDLHNNKPTYEYDASITSSDSLPDYVMIFYRYRNDWVNQPVTGMQNFSGSGGGYSVLDGVSGITFNGYSFDGAGFTCCTGGYTPISYVQIMLHEIAHELYSCPHIMAANSVHGIRWKFPASGWGMMSSFGRVNNMSANAWERWILGWIELTTGSDGTNSNIQSEADLVNGGVYTIRDFITTGDVVRIKIPYLECDDHYLWIENHQKKSVFDHKPYAGKSPSADGEVIPELDEGLYTYVENINVDRTNITTTLIRDGANGINVLNAQGNYDYWHSLTAPPETSDYYWSNTLFTFQRLDENPISGINPYFQLPDNYPDDPQVPGSDGRITYNSHWNSGRRECYSIIRETDGINTAMTYAYLGGVSEEANSLFGRRSDAFKVGDEVSLSGIIPALNYPIYNQTLSELSDSYLNGINVKVLAYNPTTGEYQIEIKFNDYEVRENKRWCGNISLPDNTKNSDPDLILKQGISLDIDRNVNANRHTKHPVYNNFINPSVFTIKSLAKIKLEPNSLVNIKNNSEFIMESGSTLEITAGAVMDVKNTGKLTAFSGANIKLNDITSEIICRSGSVINICNANLTGSGKINDVWVNYIRSNLVLNNNTIKSANVIELNNTSVGSNTNAELYAVDEITIDGTFEVPVNSTFGADIIQCPLNSN
ncbi:MAG: hypothetical protein JXB49_18365 [Bacteroidales bacterium]|nr:hypothetical protein [Bacteroidales bacterium]